MIKLSNVSFTYANGSKGLKEINLEIKKGEVILLSGGSGCGKTTLTKLLNGIIPHYQAGRLEGSIEVAGMDIPNIPIYRTAAKIGSVFQNPKSQFFNTDTTSELAFACENLGVHPDDTIKRIKKVSKALSIEKLLNRNIFKLSGGEKQKIACGAAAAIEPEVFVLDEPTSNLDSEGIRNLRESVLYWKSQGKTVIIAEHRIYWITDICDRVVFLSNGEISSIMSGSDLRNKPTDELAKMGVRTGNLNSISYSAGFSDDHKKWIDIRNFIYSYGKRFKAADISELKVPQGGVTALIGKNGAGKSTFCSLMCGLIRARKSNVVMDGISYTARQRLSLCYMVMQDVNHQLFTESVLDEVELSQKEEEGENVEEILKAFDLYELKERHPMSLSGGQKQRCAIASAVASGSKIVIYDEPTSGLDYIHMSEVAANIEKIKKTGRTQIVVTHDPELILKCCDYVVHLEEGAVKEAYRLGKENVSKLLDFFTN